MEKDKTEIIKNILDIPAETITIEFKRLSGEKIVKKIIETMVAMANTEGGTIVLGVDDPEKTKQKGLQRIYGIEENQEVFDSIGHEIHRIVPPLSGVWPPSLISVPQREKKIALLFIPKITDNFRSIDNHVFIRGEKGNRQLKVYELLRFAYAKGFKKADREIIDVDMNLLETEYYREWKNERAIRGNSIGNILEKTGLAKKNEHQKLLPTIASVLLFAEYPNDLTEMKCAIRVSHYTGTIERIAETPNLIGTPKTIHGPLIKQIKDTHEYVLNLLRGGIRIPSGFKTIYNIPERAVKEAITNAVIHRDYHTKRDIEVKIFEDRIEVESPGLLPYNITRRNIGVERAEGYRNDLIVKHLREFPFPPNLDQNEGVRAMRSEMANGNLYPPLFFSPLSKNNSVKVILLNEYRATEWEKISAYLQEEKYINNEKARDITNILQRDKMSRLLKNWVKHGLLIQIIPHSGSYKETKYKLPDVSDVKNNK